MTGAGDPVRLTFDQFVRKYKEFMRQQVLRRLYSESEKNDADDMIQQVLMKLYRNFKTMPVHDAQIRLYISNTARSVTVDFSRRSYKRNEQLMDGSGDDNSEGAIERESAFEQDFDRDIRRVEAGMVIEQCLASVTPDQREALFMSAEGWTAAEIAEKQGVCVNTAKTRAFYGRQKARAAFKEQEAIEYCRELATIALPVPPDAPHQGEQLTLFDFLGVTPIAVRRRQYRNSRVKLN